MVVPYFISFDKLLSTGNQLVHSCYVLVEQGISNVLIRYPNVECLYGEVLVQIIHINIG